MGSSSKDLLHLENKYFSTPSSLESILRVCDKDSGPKKPPTDEKPLTSPGPRSQVSPVPVINKTIEEDRFDIPEVPMEED